MSETLGKYQLIEKIAQGGMAEVFLATQQSEIGGFSKRVAIKRIFPHLVDRDEIITMFIDEARIASGLNHPSIVQIYDLGVVDGALFIAMEYVEGLDLRRLCEKGIAQNNFFSREIAVRIISDVAAGLHYAHTRVDEQGQPMNIVHRDISPQNILVSVDGAVKICDFGIAKAESRLTDTMTGEFKGKFSYMSPEQLEGGSNLDRQSDVFTLGIVLYEITVRTRLFRGKSEYDTMRMVTEARVTPPSEIDPSFPRDLEHIILKSLERDRRLRYQTAQELHDALEEWLYRNRFRIGPMQLTRYVQSLEEMDGLPGSPIPQSQPQPKPQPKPLQASVDATSPVTLSEAQLLEMDGRSLRPPQDEDRTILDALTGPELEMLSKGREADSRSANLGQTRPGMEAFGSQPEPPTNPIMKTLDATDGEFTFVLDDVIEGEQFETGERQSGLQPPRELSRFPPPKNEEDQSGTIRQPRTATHLNFADDIVASKTKLPGRIGIASLVIVLLLVALALVLRSPDPAPIDLSSVVDEAVVEDSVVLKGPLVTHPRVEVLFETVPQGAAVVINGLLAQGKTPGKFPLYEGLSNEVVFYHADHRPVRLWVAGKADETPPTVEFERIQSQNRARVYLQSQPSAATVFFNGVELGTTPLRMENVEADYEHHVQMKLDEHFDFAGFVHLVSGGDNRVEARLDSRTSVSRNSFVEIDFQIQPRGTRVEVGGETRGGSPFLDNQRRDHLLELRFEGHEREPMTRRLATSEVGTFLFRSALEATPRATGEVSMNVRPDAAIFIASRSYRGSRMRNVNLPEGRHTVVFETVQGQRIRTEIEVKANQKNQFDVVLLDGKAMVKVYD